SWMATTRSSASWWKAISAGATRQSTRICRSWSTACPSPTPASTGTPPSRRSAACMPRSGMYCHSASAAEFFSTCQRITPEAGSPPPGPLSIPSGPLVHVACNVRARRDHLVTLLRSVFQRLRRQQCGQSPPTQRIRHEGAVDIDGLLAQVHVGQIRAPRLVIDVEHPTLDVMLNSNILIHLRPPLLCRPLTPAD